MKNEIKKLPRRGILNFSLLLLMILSLSGRIASSQTYSWQVIPNGMYNFTNYYDLNFINANTGWLVHIYGMIYKTTDAGLTFTMTDSIYIGGFTDVVFLNESTGWVSSNSNNLFKTTNGGSNLVRITNFPNHVPSGLTCIHNIGDQFIYGCGNELANATFIKSADGGATWFSKSLLNIATGLTDCHMFDENTGVAAGCLRVGSENEALVVRTVDGGNNWTVVYNGNRQREIVQRLWFVNSTTGYASVERATFPERYVLKTTNAGQSWIELPFPNVHERGIGFINENTGWVGGYFQPTYGTTDGGLTWFNANIGQFIFGFQFFGDTLGYACGQYIYRYGRTVNVTLFSTEVPEEFVLHQNFPNPFNPETVIRFEVPERAEISITVYDALGREVNRLVKNEFYNEGIYEVRFSGESLPAGMYFYSLNSRENTLTRKMAIVK